MKQETHPLIPLFGTNILKPYSMSHPVLGTWDASMNQIMFLFCGAYILEAVHKYFDK